MVFSRSPADQFQEQTDLFQCMCLRCSLIDFFGAAPLINFQELQRWRGLVRSCPLLDPQVSRQKVQLETLHETETIARSKCLSKKKLGDGKQLGWEWERTRGYWEPNG